jgi:hypothetical protein
MENEVNKYVQYRMFLALSSQLDALSLLLPLSSFLGREYRAHPLLSFPFRAAGVWEFGVAQYNTVSGYAS